jgi:aminotransferase in exopolysaccharide biosynthesis
MTGSESEWSMNLTSAVVGAIQSVCGDPAVLHEPVFGGREWDYVKDCLDSTFVSSVGKYVDRFEAELAEYTGAKHAIAVVNGTAALHIALMLAGVEPDDEVLMPSLTFVATANAVRYCGAEPHFVDSDNQTLGICPGRLREWLGVVAVKQGEYCLNRKTGRRIRALLPMHTFGHPSDLEGLAKVAADYGLELVEDAAESLGSYYMGRHTGTFGLLGTLSFNGNKTITTGGGGAILTNNSELARLAKHITTTAKMPHSWEYIHDRVGYNYRMPNLNAALGCAQLEQLPKFLTAKRKLHDAYKIAFQKIEGAKIVSEPPYSSSNYWLQALMLDKNSASARDAILKATNEAGFGTRPVWRLMHHLPSYKSSPRAPLDEAEWLEKTIINIPSGSGILK